MDKFVDANTEIFKSKKLFYNKAVDFINDLAMSEISKKGFFTIALSGGSTPLPLFRALSKKSNFPFSKTYFFWSDERMVSRKSKESNSGNFLKEFENKKSCLVSENLFLPPISDKSVAQDNLNIAVRKASEYDETIRLFLKDKGVEALDLVLLGMGDDFHTASIFPDSPLLEDQSLVSAVLAPKEYKTSRRISFTMPFINRASTRLFLLSGPSKYDGFRSIEKLIFSSKKNKKTPVSFIKNEDTYWYLVIDS